MSKNDYDLDSLNKYVRNKLIGIRDPKMEALIASDITLQLMVEGIEYLYRVEEPDKPLSFDLHAHLDEKTASIDRAIADKLKSYEQNRWLEVLDRCIDWFEKRLFRQLQKSWSYFWKVGLSAFVFALIVICYHYSPLEKYIKEKKLSLKIEMVTLKSLTSDEDTINWEHDYNQQLNELNFSKKIYLNKVLAELKEDANGYEFSDKGEKYVSDQLLRKCKELSYAVKSKNDFITHFEVIDSIPEEDFILLKFNSVQNPECYMLKNEFINGQPTIIDSTTGYGAAPKINFNYAINKIFLDQGIIGKDAKKELNNVTKLSRIKLSK